MRKPITGLAALCLLACAQQPAGSLVSYVVQDDAIPKPLTARQSLPSEGLRVFVDREAGHCVLCHRVAGLEAPFQGDIGPDLSAVGARLTAGQIRLRIVDASRVNPETIMPPYYRTDGLFRVAVDYRNTPALDAAQIERLVAYLASLKG